MVYANLYKFLILVVFIKTNFACTYEKRYDEIEVSQQLQNVTKTRTVCCKGYIRNKEEHNKVICYPECKNCIKGYCPEPSKCICNDGYMGENCTEMCADGKWGTDCLGTCSCVNRAQCDRRTGRCICAIGWTGKNCEQRTMKERINATNWVRVDDAQEHDKILKNISNVLTKFTESVEDLHKTVSVVKTSKQVDGVRREEQLQDGNTVISEPISEPIVPAKLEPSAAINISDVYPLLLVGISILLIILTIILTFKIRNSIIFIRKIQQNPAEQFRKKLKNESVPADQQQVERPTQLNIPEDVTTTAFQNVAPKKSLKPQQRELPDVPSPGNIYDSVNETKKRQERNSYVTMDRQPNPPQPKPSPIKELPVSSFIHKKALIASTLNMGKPNLGPAGLVPKVSPVETEDLYESIKPQLELEQEVEYETVSYYSTSK